ncbi:MAG TPA: hypothetical protein VI032_10845, partial [Burkholderiaceae bacterium]
ALAHRLFVRLRAFTPLLRQRGALGGLRLGGRRLFGRAGLVPASGSGRGGRAGPAGGFGSVGCSRLTWLAHLQFGRRCRCRCGTLGGELLPGLLVRNARAPLFGAPLALCIVEDDLFARHAVERASPLGLGPIDAIGDGKTLLALAHGLLVALLRRGALGIELIAAGLVRCITIGRLHGHRQRRTRQEPAASQSQPHRRLR